MPMQNNVTVFDDAWFLHEITNTCPASWVVGVLETFDAGGKLYLDSIRAWFENFPHPSDRDQRALSIRLESFNNSDHLGGVNELSWWQFMRKTELKAEPVATTTTPRPDFQLLAPSECFLEVSTLNVSAVDQEKFARDEGVSLNHAATLRRILLKAADEKRDQIAFGTNSKQPSVLVLFDYTTWSWQGTQAFQSFADALFGADAEFSRLPVDLSALVYVERKVMEGRIAISRDRSAIYYNPNATYPLPVGTFGAIRQFLRPIAEWQPEFEDHWVWL